MRRKKTKTLEQLAAELRADHARLGNWRAVSAAWHGIDDATLCRIAKGNYEPKDPHIRHLLELPIYLPAPACPECGDVHVAVRCPRRPPALRSNWDTPTEELRWQLENRVPA